MASGGNPRPTGTIPKVVRNNSNIPQEVVTPTRRDIHGSNVNNTSIDWVPVSEQNSRPAQNRTRKSTNIQAENEFSDLDILSQERGSRFVPVRPQPRSLVLRQRDNMGDHSDDPYNNFMGGNSPHTSHAAIMIVNPTTPNSNSTNQSVSSSGSMNRNDVRAGSVGRDTSYSSNTVPVCPHPINTANSNSLSNKPMNISNSEPSSDNMMFQNGNGHVNYQEGPSSNQPEVLLPRTEAIRAMGDNIVATCPEAARVEQRLGQIREYIRVTSSLVESMRNSEDELKRRIKSLKECNAALAAQARAVDDEGINETGLSFEVEEPDDEEDDADLQELLKTLQNLKDSEKKLEGMLLYLDDRVKDANDKIDSVCSVRDPKPVEYVPSEPNIEIDCLVVDDDKGSGETNSASEYQSVAEIKDSSSDDKVLDAVVLDEGLCRPTSAQSSFSAYSDNELYQSEMKTNLDLTQIRLAAALQEQRRLLKYQAEAKEQLAEMQMSRIVENGSNLSHNDLSNHQELVNSSGVYATPPNNHQPLSSAKVYGINQIGVATTLPHISENNCNWNNHGGIERRTTLSSERDGALDGSESRHKPSTSAGVDQNEMNMLRDLQMRRHHLESQVSKIQNLHTTSSSLMDAMSTSAVAESGLADSRPWGGSEASEDDRLGQGSDNSIRNKVATVNVMKAELERLKNMLRTVDSIQNNFGVNSTVEDDHLYDNDNQVTHDDISRNRNRISESVMSNHLPLSRRDSSSSAKRTKDGQDGNTNSKNQNVPLGLLSRLQNCIASSGKCTNISEPQPSTSDYIGSELLAIQQLTDELKLTAQGINDERKRLSRAVNKDLCASSSSSIKSDDKKRTNSVSVSNPPVASSNYPPYAGPAERKQQALKAELEAKKKQLERLMSKVVDHRTNQQTSQIREDSSNKETTSGDASSSTIKTEPSCSYQNLPLPNDIHNGYYSSDQDDEDTYQPSSHNVNQPNEESSRKSPSRCSSQDNIKDEPCYFGDSTRSLDGSFIGQTTKHNKLQKVNKSPSNKHQNKIITQVCPPMDGAAETFESQVRDLNRSVSEMCVARTLSQDREGLRPITQPLPDCFLSIPTNNATLSKDICDISNISNASSSSSGGDRDPVPPPMATLPPRHRHNSKSNRNNLSADSTPPQWHSPQAESHVTMWWHNKANQLQQQLELTTNLCQSLLQDKRMSQTSPSTLHSFPQTGPAIAQNVPNNTATMMPIPPLQPYQSNPMLNNMNMGNPFYPPPTGYFPVDLSPMWTYQQQQLAQQHQVAAAAWGSSQCIQHLLTQQREISMIRNSLSSLEERMQYLNINMPRAHSTPPNVNYMDNIAHSQVMRTNSNQLNFSQMWPNNQFNNDFVSQPSNTSLNRVPTSKFPPNASIDHTNTQQLPANFSLPFQQETVSDQFNMFLGHNSIPVNQQSFNNCISQPLINPNMSNVNNSHLLHTNRNLNSLTNVTQHATAMSNAMGQPLTGQSMALNNQVPPGNRANNYWDNFRSYSRQNLLSGNNKVNAGVSLTHSPHPLVERSHNTLHNGTPTASSATITNTQVTNTPKRDVNLQGNMVQPDNDLAQRRGRRNLSQDASYTAAPPDVLNVNQNLDLEGTHPSVNILSNSEISNDNRLHDTHNINLNRSNDPVPEIIQSHANNLNVPRTYGAYKRKSSSKLPAKNACNTGNYVSVATHNRNIETQNENTATNPNLASTSNAVSREKSTTKLFDLLRESVYSEVTALISANESRPHFLIQLFRDLQQISSDTLRQRALQSIQELVTHYLSNVDPELYEHSDQSNAQIACNSLMSNINENHSSLHIDNEIIKFILTHHSDICTAELLEALCHVIIATIGNVSNHAYLNQRLNESFINYQGCKVMDISEELIMTISGILTSFHNEIKEEDSSIVNKMEDISSHTERTENECDDNACISKTHDEAVGPLCIENANVCCDMQDEASSIPALSQVNQNVGAPLPLSDPKVDLIESVENYNGDLAEADQSCQGSEATAASGDGTLEAFLPDVVDTEEQTPTEAEAEWLGLDRVPTRLQMDDNPENQIDGSGQT